MEQVASKNVRGVLAHSYILQLLLEDLEEFFRKLDGL